MVNIFSNHFSKLFSNYLEKDYFVNKNESSKEDYRKILIIIFTVLLVIYFYFFYDSYSDFKDYNSYSDEKKRKVILSFTGSTLILVSGFIFWYLAVIDDNLDVELAFN